MKIEVTGKLHFDVSQNAFDIRLTTFIVIGTTDA